MDEIRSNDERRTAAGGTARVARRSIRQRRRLRARLDDHGLALTVDIGRGGFLVQVMRTIPVGTSVSGTLHVNGAEVPFQGCVAWVSRGNPRLQIFSKVGVRFVGMPEGLDRLVGPPAILDLPSRPSPLHRSGRSSSTSGTTSPIRS